MKPRWKTRMPGLAVAALILGAAFASEGRADYVGGLNPYGDNYLSLRAGPGSGHREILRMGPGTYVEVLTRSGNWLRVRLDDGTIGWAYARYVRRGDPSGADRDSPPERDVDDGDDWPVGVVSGLNPRGDNYLSLRSGPGTGFRELTRLRPWTRLYIFERQGSWYRVATEEGIEGFVAARFVTIEAPDGRDFGPDVGEEEQQEAVSPVDRPPPAPPAPPPPAQPPREGAWVDYVNDRFGTTISYPSGMFVPGSSPENDDGLSFSGVDGQAWFLVFGQFNPLDKTVAELAEEDEAAVGFDRVTYRREGADWYVLSGPRGREIVYRKVTLDDAGAVLHVFEMGYAADARRVYEPILARMVESFGSMAAVEAPGSATEPPPTGEEPPGEAIDDPDAGRPGDGAAPPTAGSSLRDLFGQEFETLRDGQR